MLKHIRFSVYFNVYLHLAVNFESFGMLVWYVAVNLQKEIDELGL